MAGGTPPSPVLDELPGAPDNRFHTMPPHENMPRVEIATIGPAPPSMRRIEPIAAPF